jgi:hypothetical protein
MGRSQMNNWMRFCSAALLAFASSAFIACVARTYNTDSGPTTLFQIAHPRIAIDSVGMGWCYYLEDKNVPAVILKTDEVEDDVDVNLSTGIETKNRFQLLYIIRQFKKSHELSMDLTSFEEWRRKNPSYVAENNSEWDALGFIDSELQNSRSLFEMREFESSLCKTIYKDTNKPDFALLQKRFVKESKRSEYVVRCYGDSGQLMSRSKLQQLSDVQYKTAKRILIEVTTLPDYEPLRRRGANCRDGLRQMEISRGRLLESSQRKVW